MSPLKMMAAATRSSQQPKITWAQGSHTHTPVWQRVKINTSSVFGRVISSHISLHLEGFVLLSIAKGLGGNRDGLSMLPPSPCKPSWQQLQQKRKHTHTKKRKEKEKKKTKSTTVGVSRQKYYVPALHRVLLVLPARNLHHNTMRSFTPASPVVGEGR